MIYVIEQKTYNSYIPEGEPGHELKAIIGIHDSLESVKETVNLITKEDVEFLTKRPHLKHIKQKLTILSVELNTLINI